jgi:hypothetical protein
MKRTPKSSQIGSKPQKNAMWRSLNPLRKSIPIVFLRQLKKEKASRISLSMLKSSYILSNGIGTLLSLRMNR